MVKGVEAAAGAPPSEGLVELLEGSPGCLGGEGSDDNKDRSPEEPLAGAGAGAGGADTEDIV